MKTLWKATLGVRAWALRNVYLIWFVRPRILQVDENRCVVRIGLNWRTRNHLKSMYFGALCIGADVAGGLIAFHLMETRKVRVAFVFKDVKAQFLKRPEGAVHFTCEDGPAIQELMRRTVETGERQETTVRITATVPEKLGDEPVALFELTLSLKKR
jgi:acyl-coenzyme A thioesterase PaaI-like protein